MLKSFRAISENKDACNQQWCATDSHDRQKDTTCRIVMHPWAAHCQPIDNINTINNQTTECKISSINWTQQYLVKSLSRVRLFVTPWSVAYQAPPSIGFPRQEYWSGVPLPSLSAVPKGGPKAQNTLAIM